MCTVYKSQLAFPVELATIFRFRTPCILQIMNVLLQPRGIPSFYLKFLIDLERGLNVYSRSSMRRLCSITIIAAMMCSLVSPALAATCPHAKQVMMCHRERAGAQPEHHCDMMMDEQTEPAASDSTGAAVTGSQTQQNCPMDCCAPGQRTNAIVISAAPPLTLTPVAERSSFFVPVTFTSTGFSSHTDRGPPSIF
jgi:hypothetical protein